MYRQPHKSKPISPGFNNQKRETPKASAASLFDGGFGQNQYNSHYNQNDFSSFINQPATAPVTNGPMCAEPPQNSAAPPPSAVRNQLGTPLQTNTPVNPYRRPLKNTKSLFASCCNNGFTPVTFATTSCQSKLSPSVLQSIENSAPSVLPIIQTTAESQRLQAEEDNDRLREEKISQRNENSKRFQTKRDQMILEQEAAWKQKKEERDVSEAFSDDVKPFQFAERPKTKAERKEIRERARKARLRRNERRENVAGDLSSLIDEISSIGTSVCSDDINKLNSCIEAQERVKHTHQISPDAIGTSGLQQQPITNQGQSYLSPTEYTGNFENTSPYLESGWEESVINQGTEACDSVNDMVQPGYSYEPSVYHNSPESNMQLSGDIANFSNARSEKLISNQNADTKQLSVQSFPPQSPILNHQMGNDIVSSNSQSETYSNSQIDEHSSTENKQITSHQTLEYSQMHTDQSSANLHIPSQHSIGQYQISDYNSLGNDQFSVPHSKESILVPGHHSLEGTQIPTHPSSQESSQKDNHHSLDNAKSSDQNLCSKNATPVDNSLQLQQFSLQQETDSHPSMYKPTYDQYNSSNGQQQTSESVMSSFYPVQYNSLEKHQKQSDILVGHAAAQQNYIGDQKQCESFQPEIENANLNEVSQFSNLQEDSTKSQIGEYCQNLDGNSNQYSHSQQAADLFYGTQEQSFDSVVNHSGNEAVNPTLHLSDRESTYAHDNDDLKHGKVNSNQNITSNSLQYDTCDGHPIDNIENINHPIEAPVNNMNLDSQRNTEDMVHDPYRNESIEPQYISDLGNQNYYALSDENLDELKKKKPSRASSDESHATITSTEGSSYGFIPSVKSSDSESRLSPYQFIDGGRYPCQSSENSNNSSPLEIIENISAASTSYENVMRPNQSLSMSSFDITEPVDNIAAPVVGDTHPAISNSEIQEPNVVREFAASSGNNNLVVNESGMIETTTASLFDKQKELEKTAAELFQRAKQVQVRKEEQVILSTSAVVSNQGQSIYSSGTISSQDENLQLRPSNQLFSMSNQSSSLQSGSHINKVPSVDRDGDISMTSKKNPQSIQLSQPTEINPQLIQNSPPSGPNQQPTVNNHTTLMQVSSPSGINQLPMQKPQVLMSGTKPNEISQLPTINPQSLEVHQSSGINQQSVGMSKAAIEPAEINTQSIQVSQAAMINPPSMQLSQPPIINPHPMSVSHHTMINPQSMQVSQPPMIIPQVMQGSQPPMISSQPMHLSQPVSTNLQSMHVSQLAGTNPQPIQVLQAQMTNPLSRDDSQHPMSNTQLSQVSQPTEISHQPMIQYQIESNNLQSTQLPSQLVVNPHSKQIPSLPLTELKNQTQLNHEVQQHYHTQNTGSVVSPQSVLSSSQSSSVSPPHSSGIQEQIIKPVENAKNENLFNKNSTISETKQPEILGLQYFRKNTPQSPSSGSPSLKSLEELSSQALSPQPSNDQQDQLMTNRQQTNQSVQAATIISPASSENSHYPISTGLQVQSPVMQHQFQQPIDSSPQTAQQSGNPAQVQADQLVKPLLHHQMQLPVTLAQQSLQQPVNLINQQVHYPADIVSQQIQQPILTAQQPIHESATSRQQIQPAFQSSQPGVQPNSQQVAFNSGQQIGQTSQPVSQIQVAGNQAQPTQPFHHQAPEGLQLPVQPQYQQMQPYPPGQPPSLYGQQGPYMQQNQYGQPLVQSPYDPAFPGAEQQQMEQMMWDYQQQQSYWAANYYNQYNPYMSPAFDYGYQYYNWPFPSADQYSYTSSAASSDYGGSRCGSVIERPSSRSSGQVCSELAELSSELSFHNRAEVTQEESMQRSTPLSFTRPHVVARFLRSSGMIGVVAPKQPLDGEVACIQNVKVEDIVDISIFTRFPGPLVRGDTNKKQMTGFINETIHHYLPSLYKENSSELFAYIALWEFVGMLVKQNGTFDGADVSDLLISLLQARRTEGVDKKLFTTLSHPPNSSTESMLEEFHRYMATGRTKDGLDHAISSKLWGHAFMLGSLMGEKWITYVQTKYQHSLSKTDPIRTLYAHLHNKDPEYFQKKANIETWVQNLCMLVSQKSGYPDRDKERIVGFGDSLRDQGLIAAAHLCYIIAETAFGNHTCKDDRIALIGLEHKNSLTCRPSVWAKPLNTQLTEIYIYARTLHSKEYTLPQYQKYKYEYGMQLVEFGYPMQGLAYMESIGQTIICDKTFLLYDSELCCSIMRHAKDILLLEAENYAELEYPSWINALEDYVHKRVSSHPSTALEKSVPESFLRRSNMDGPEDLVDSCKETSNIDDPIINGRKLSNSYLSEYNQHHDVLSNENFIQGNYQRESIQDYTAEQPFTDYNKQYIYDNNKLQNFSNNTEEQTSEFDNVPYGEYDYCSHDLSDTNIKKESENSEQTSCHQNQNQSKYDDQHNYPLQRYPVNEFGSDYDIKFQHVPDNQMEPFDQMHYDSNDLIIKNESIDNECQEYRQDSKQNDEYNYGQSQVSHHDLTADYSVQQSFDRYKEKKVVTQDSAGDLQLHQQSDNINQEPVEEEDLFSGFSSSRKKKSSKGKQDDLSGKSDNKKSDLGNENKSSKGWLGGIGTYISKLTNRKEVFLPDDNDKSLVFDEKLGKWVDRNGEDEDVKSKPPPPPPKAATPFMRDTNVEGENEDSYIPPVLSPSMPRKVSPDIPPMISKEVSPPEVEKKNEKSTKFRKQRKTLLQKSKEASKSKETEVEKTKIVTPASPFSMRASKSTKRGPNRYVNVMGDSVKSTQMMPILDPMANPAPFKSQDTDGLIQECSDATDQPNKMPIFFDPSKLQG